MAFDLRGQRVEDFASALGDDQHEFLAFAIPTTESAAEACILRGPWQKRERSRVLRFMESATPALTVILERLLNADRSSRLAEQLHSLANAAQVLTRSEDVEVALTDLATAVTAATGAEYIVNIDLYDPATGRFVLRAIGEHRHTTKTFGQVWKVSLNPNQITHWQEEVMRTLQPRFALDMQNDLGYPEYVRKFYARALLRSALDFPLLFQDEFLGVMSFVSFKPCTFPPEEVNLLQGFVSQTAVALKALQMHKELQRYAQEIKRAADQYITTTNLTGDIIARLDKRGDWTFLNDAACQFFGKARAKLLGASSTTFLHPDDMERTAQSIRETREKKGLTTGFINRFVTPLGIRVVEWNGSPLFDEDGQYTGIQITGRDITERRQMEEALAAKTEEYIATTNLTGDLIAKLDRHGNWAFLNDAACQFYGGSREELLGTDSRAYAHPDDLEATAEAIRDTIAKRKLVRGLVTRATTPMGIRVVEWNGYPLFDEENQYAGIQITGRDITERKEMEEALRENEARLRLVTDNTSDLIWTMDLSLRYTYMSPSITRMRGYTVEEIVGLSGADAMTPASFELARKVLAEEMAIERMGDADPNRSAKVELEMYCKDGSTIWTEMSMIFLRDSDGRPVGILGVTRNISERKKAEEERERLQAELQERAITDGLTGLYNHVHFFERLGEEVERSKRYNRVFAVVMMDVDNFKLFNDSYGHQAGDAVLRLVADGIRSGLRSSDLAFRYGGDEFAAILLHADPKKAHAVIDRIRRRIARSLKQMDIEAPDDLALSIGVAHFPNDGTTADALVRVADTALYSAKGAALTRDVASESAELAAVTAADPEPGKTPSLSSP